MPLSAKIITANYSFTLVITPTCCITCDCAVVATVYWQLNAYLSFACLARWLGFCCGLQLFI